MAVQQPGVGGDKFVAADHNGALLLFYPTAYRTDIPTQHGTSDAVETKVVNLDTGQVLDNTMIFGKVLVGQLKGAVPNDQVLGRLGQGQNQKGNPPWMLFSYSEAEYARAEAWMAANPQGPTIQQPAPSTPAASPAPGTWGGPPQGGPAGGPAPAPWQNVGAPANQPQAPAPQPQAPAWGAPAAPAAPAPAPAAWTPPQPAAPAPAPAPALDPQLEAFLRSKGVDPAMFPNQDAAVAYANMIAAQ